MVLTGQQIRAARAILRLKAIELAEKAGVGLSTVQRAEAVDGPAPMIRANMDVIRRTLEACGIEFLPEDGGGGGVRLRLPGGAPAPAYDPPPPAAPQAPPAPPPADVAPIAEPTADNILTRLRAACAGNQRAFARKHDIVPSILSEVLSGRRDIPPSIMKALGVVERKTYPAATDKPGKR